MAEELEAREAVRQAYQAYYRRLVAALYALTGDYSEAQDLVQEAYARALARPRVFLDVADPEAWLRTVAVNLARTRWRRRRLFDTLVRTGRVTRTPESVPGADPNRVALVAALQQLSRPTREAIVLHHLADMSVYEVAEALGVPVGTVKARLSRGRTMLATLLNERADEPVEPAAPGDQPAAPAPRAAEPPRAAAPRMVEPPAPQSLPATEPPRAPDLLSWPGRP
jgi:RNA polymerase sigma-70 factor (ECF subfamily)